MIVLPLPNQRWPKFRLLTRNSWGGSLNSGDGWTIRPMQNHTPYAVGFILLNYTRCLLPQFGTCEILYRFGEFSGRTNSIPVDSRFGFRQGEPWDNEAQTLDIPNLTGQEIRIQINYPDEDGNVTEADWRTVWWGTCEYQIDEGLGAATLPSGDRKYFCIDAFARTRRWFLDRHGFNSSAGLVSPCAGHPGYNVSRNSPSHVAGNRDPSVRWDRNGDGVTSAAFTMPGVGNKWTDQEAVNNSLSSTRPPGEPFWYLDGATELFDGKSPWAVQDGESAFDFVSRVCKRGRGRGSVLPDFRDGASPTGPLTCYLTVFPQTFGDIVYQDPTASQVTIPGASTEGTQVDVDMLGDHRFVESSLRLGDADQYRVDCLVSQGEQIEVLGTVEWDKTLEAGWSAAEQAAFDALIPEARTSERWHPVYQFYRLKRNFSMMLSNGFAGAQSSGDYQCNDDGDIVSEPPAGSIGRSYLPTIEVMDDLPLYSGYDYTNYPPTRQDGQTSAQFAGIPNRRKLMAFLRKSGEDRYTDLDGGMSFGMQVSPQPDGFLISNAEDQKIGQRYLTSEGQRYVLTLGFRLPHRVRIATGNPNASRKMVINHQNIHLWLAHPGAIWDLNDTDATSVSDYPPKRNAGGSNGILRDDRSELAALHALAVAWYRPKKNGEERAIRRNATWALKCCGDIPSSEDYDGGGVVYPTCGQVVRYMRANGHRIELNSVVSSISYDNETGTTTWMTDWQELDFTNG